MPYAAFSVAMHPAAAHVSGDTCAVSTILAVPCVATGTHVARTPWERTSDGLSIVGGVEGWLVEEEMEGAPPCPWPHAVLVADKLVV